MALAALAFKHQFPTFMPISPQPLLSQKYRGSKSNTHHPLPQWLHIMCLQGSSMELGDENSSWDGFQLPSIDLGDGVTINPATVDLNTLEQLADDVASQ